MFKMLFLFNLFCNLFPCDYEFPQPELTEEYYKNQRTGKRLENLPDPIVHMKIGSVEGYRQKSSKGRLITSFEGIPFGEDTSGYQRFKPPIPKKPWKGILQTKKPGPYCLQLHLVKMGRVIGEENCLYLNIYTPTLDFNDNSTNLGNYPTLIYFHGGSYLFGSGAEYGPSYLLDQDLILVTINFRMGVLGFLSTEDSTCPGNMGMKDQTLAIKFVYDHISKFGGDPNRITLFGQSAGAASVGIHLISNASRPYYSGAISLSGSSFLHWGVLLPGRAKTYAHRIARLVKCPTYNNNKLVECLRNTNPAMLVSAQFNLFEWLPFPPVFFGPVVEPEDPGAFLTKTPDEVYASGNANPVPYVVSLMETEGHSGLYVMNLLGRFPKIRRDPIKYMPVYLDFDYLDVDKVDVVDKISKFYFGNVSILDAPKIAFVDMQSDRYFVTGIQKGLKAHSQIAPTYAYMFSYLSQYNMGTALGQLESELGVGHGEDMFFYFNSSIYSPGFRKSDPEYQMSQIMINLITNFAHKREPLYTEGNRDLKIWDPIDNPNKIRFLNVGRHVSMIENHFLERVKFWESLDLPDTKPLKIVKKPAKS